MRALRNVAAAAMLLGTAAYPASAQPSGQMLGDSCAVCHATDGKGGVERIAGMSKGEFSEEMHEFVFEPGEGRLMSVIAKAFTDAEIQAMAAHFAAIGGGAR
ncbi:MAG: hypothetical protein U1E45_06385 [Geminicoccaceae bacterium]